MDRNCKGLFDNNGASSEAITNRATAQKMTINEPRPVKPLLVTPKYDPPETYQGHVAKRVNSYLDSYTHVILVDADTEVPREFYDLPKQYYEAEIITPKIVPASPIYRTWETMTYWARLNRVRLRGSAVIYSTAFLKRVGGYPDVTAPDTWLYNHASKEKVVQVPMIAYHEESFSLSHSISTQKRSGKARAEMKQSVWRVTAHSLFRLRPLVLFTYLYYRAKKN